MTMKYFITLLLLLTLSTSCAGSVLLDLISTDLDRNDNWFYLEMKKTTNGSYLWKLPAVEMSIRRGWFVFEPEIALLYTSPRSSALSLNHHSVDANFNMGIQAFDFFATVSLGLNLPIAGNSEGLPPTLNLYNTVRGGIKF